CPREFFVQMIGGRGLCEGRPRERGGKHQQSKARNHHAAGRDHHVHLLHGRTRTCDFLRKRDADRLLAFFRPTILFARRQWGVAGLLTRSIDTARKTDFLFPSIFQIPCDTRRPCAMEFKAQQCDVRSEYSHALAEACQRFVGSLLVLEPDAFVGGVTRLTADSPRPENRAEAVLSWASLREVVTRGAHEHHVWFHRRLQNTPCDFCVAPLRAPDSFGADRTCSIVRDWAIEFVWAFDARHQWPPAIRAAYAMRSDPMRGWYVDELSAAIGTSRATLERSFSRIYRTTVQGYGMRV